MSVGKRDNLTRFQTLLIFLIVNGMIKTKLAILPILCCEEIVKNSIGYVTSLYLALNLESMASVHCTTFL